MGLICKMLGFQILTHAPFTRHARWEALPRGPGEDTSRESRHPREERPTLKLRDARQLGRVEKPVGERLVLESDAAELLPAVHVPGAHAHADPLGLGVLVEVLAHALQHFRGGCSETKGTEL